MTLNELAAFLLEGAAEAEKQPPCMSLLINENSDSVELLLDSKRNTYSDWIPGEGGDIGLIRDRETNKVVGVRLPLYVKRLVVARAQDNDCTTLFEDA